MSAEFLFIWPHFHISLTPVWHQIALHFQSVISEDVETQKHGVVIKFAGGDNVG